MIGRPTESVARMVGSRSVKKEGTGIKSGQGLREHQQTPHTRAERQGKGRCNPKHTAISSACAPVQRPEEGHKVWDWSYGGLVVRSCVGAGNKTL